MIRSTTAAGKRAAQAALDRPLDADLECDRYLLIDDTDEYASEIRTILCERGHRALEVLS